MQLVFQLGNEIPRQLLIMSVGEEIGFFTNNKSIAGRIKTCPILPDYFTL
jgi:hypothetical protein